MKKIFIFLLPLTTLVATAQNPLIVKSVGTTVLQPNITSNSDFWKYNEWNGIRFYQGTGTPSKLCSTDGSSAGTKYITGIGEGSISATIPAQDFMYLITAKTITTPSFL